MNVRYRIDHSHVYYCVVVVRRNNARTSGRTTAEISVSLLNTHFNAACDTFARRTPQSENNYTLDAPTHDDAQQRQCA